MEEGCLGTVPSLVDLSLVDAGQRAAVWSRAAPALFPGLSVSRVQGEQPTGAIRRVGMGGGSLWAVRSPPATVSYCPTSASDAEPESFTVMLQLSGGTTVNQKQRACALEAGDICLLDEHFPFNLEGTFSNEIVFLRMPRAIVLARNPHLEHRTATTLTTLEASASLIGGTLTQVLHTAPFMAESQRRIVLGAMIQLLGTVEQAGAGSSASSDWRVQAALSYIDLNFVIAGLSAEAVAQAQRISRRRLDQLLLSATGVSITGNIWNKRLEQAALDLCDPTRLYHTASQIGFANGFEDAAHFTRAFKRRYGHSPLQWRHLGGPVPGSVGNA